MPQLTISEAIRQSPIGKSQFYSKYIDGGLITVSVDHSGKKYIDSSELLRVFGELTGGQSEDVRRQSDSDSDGVNIVEQSEVIKLLKEQLAKTEAREEKHLEHIVSLTLRLEAPANQYRPNPFVRWWRGLDNKQ